jgi:hypothetical protein
MPVSRGYPKGSGAVAPVATDGLSGGDSSQSAQTAFDSSSIVSGLADIVAGLVEVPKEVMTALALSSGQGLVVLANDYRAYFDLTAYSGSILKAMNTGILMVYGQLAADNGSTVYLDNGATITIKGT